MSKPSPTLFEPRPVERITADQIDPAALIALQRPVVVEGAVRDWPLVAAGSLGTDNAMDYLKGAYQGRPVVGYTGKPEHGGRFFYDKDLSGFNYLSERVRLDEFLDRMRARLDDSDSPAFYVGSTDVDQFLPGFRDENDLRLDPASLGGVRPLISIWIGTRTVAATHYDQSNNIACCMVGRRRFTLFPPEQVANLYPGPLDPTPGGQVVSMVDLAAPDLASYPRFADALAAAWVADLAPGDALVYPALWWHNVEALEPFNVMVNYWWNVAESFMDSPTTTMLHAMLSLRERPEHEKQAWRALFDYYVFGPADRPAMHLPAAAQGLLAPLDELSARRLRALVLHKLNR